MLSRYPFSIDLLTGSGRDVRAELTAQSMKARWPCQGDRAYEMPSRMMMTYAEPAVGASSRSVSCEGYRRRR